MWSALCSLALRNLWRPLSVPVSRLLVRLADRRQSGLAPGPAGQLQARWHALLAWPHRQAQRRQTDHVAGRDQLARRGAGELRRVRLAEVAVDRIRDGTATRADDGIVLEVQLVHRLL